MLERETFKSLYDHSVRVMPDGDAARARFAIVGEAPASEEVKRGMGFVGPSGRMLWPLLERLGGVTRGMCYVTNLCKHPLDNDLAPEEKLEPGEYTRCCEELLVELTPFYTRPNTRILAVGALAARALLGGDRHPLEVVNGMGFELGQSLVVPTFHPAAALRSDAKDWLAYTAVGIRHLASPPRWRVAIPPPIVEWPKLNIAAPTAYGIDTEGTPDDPICMTVATPTQRVWVAPADVRTLWRLLPPAKPKVYHNALWDWKVLEAMGVDRPWDGLWEDTMELAYLHQTEPQGLKDLMYRYYGYETKGFEDVADPAWAQNVRWAAEGRIAAGTPTETHTPKGKLRKKPKVILTPEAKVLQRALGNTQRLAKLMDFPPLSLRWVDMKEVVEYATLDPWMTLMVREALL